ncbi:glycosyltransferase [Paeniglutamicibacter sulfureus]|uniref:glycosyltransferase n=1 Tax=Paeniglutamicibacter sulfureus TaxID=43666 RepID=UPI002665DF21|nr:glycosyltransferase [Paeniglutamicibacter sulfureus]MDO2935983.1 glycosyltransferase [Paeniglutamicibacter sulfureus]
MTSICFVSETGRSERPINDPSVRYRCYHPAEVLVGQGNFVSVYSAAQFYKDPNFDYDVYVFHRPNKARGNFLPILRQLRGAGKTLIADYDDLIFGDEGMALQSSAAKNGTLTPERAIAAFASNLAGLREFDKVSVSTSPLAQRVQQSNPDADVHVVPNIIPPSVLSIHGELATYLAPRPSTAIGYFAGTKSHDRDFPVVADALHRVLMENPDFTLMVIGPVAVPPALAALPNVSTAPVVNFLRLPGLMTLCSTVIAPLEMSDFNACKSRVKFLEAALSGCRLLASPIPDMRSFESESLELMESLDDWYEALSTPVKPGGYPRAEENFEFLRSASHVDGLTTFWSEA